jgi:hypothetical protein
MRARTEETVDLTDDVLTALEARENLAAHAGMENGVVLKLIAEVRRMRGMMQDARSAMVAAEGALKVSGAGWPNVRADLRDSIAAYDALLLANHPDAFSRG